MPFDHEGHAHLDRWVQHGVVTRAQLIGFGATEADLRRLLRRDLTRVVPGVYVNHNGPLTWEQRAWVGVLAHAPAALGWESALPKSPRGGLIQVAVGHRSRITQVPGVHARRMTHLAERLHPLSAPPRVRLEHVAIDLAVGRSDVAAQFRVLADACQTRQTSAAAIAAALSSRRRVPGRRLLAELLADLQEGACSVLEREYLLLERRHGLPRAARQRRDVVPGAARPFVRDAVYERYGVYVELDGRPFHDTAGARERDFERDLDTAVSTEALTLRLTYGQVVPRGCATIAKVAALLRRRGWADPFLRCSAC